MRRDNSKYIDQLIEEALKDQLGIRRNRRSVFGTLGKITASIIIAGEAGTSHTPPQPWTPSLTRPFFDRLESGTLLSDTHLLKEKTEQQFNIRFLDASSELDDYLVVKDKNIPFPAYPRVSMDWDAPHIEQLQETLAILPSHFYQRAEGQATEFVLSAYTDSLATIRRIINTGVLEGSTSFCECYAQIVNPRIVLSDSLTNPDILWTYRSRQVIAHELTHLVTLPNLNGFIQSVAKPAGITSVDDLQDKFKDQLDIKYIPIIGPDGSPLFNTSRFTPDVKVAMQTSGQEYIYINPYFGVEKKTYDAMGEIYWQTKADEHLAKVAQAQGISSSNTTADRLDHDLPVILYEESFTKKVSSKTQLGYGATNFSEFFSVATESYVQGKDIFMSVYGPILGDENAVILYNGMKQEIYRGAEYNQLKLI